MSVTYTYLLDTIETALSDLTNVTWSRAVLINFSKEAIRTFPFLQPKEQNLTLLAAAYTITLETDFREMLSVEYPVDETPPVFLGRRSRFETDFFSGEMFYDVDYDYNTGTGFLLWFSQQLPSGAEVTINYLANHDTSMADDAADTISVPDQYIHILVAYCVWKGYQERLSFYSRDPTVYSQQIAQMVQSVDQARLRYEEFIAQEYAHRAHSKITPKHDLDKFDRVY